MFYFFSAWGGGRGSPRRREGREESRFLLKIPGGGGLQEGRGGGAGRVSAANLGIWEGGGAKYFFRGRNVHQVLLQWQSDKN